MQVGVDVACIRTGFGGCGLFENGNVFPLHSFDFVFDKYTVKSWPKNSANVHKNREKNFQFFGVNDFKIRCRVFEIKFIKGKNFNE